MSNKKIFAALNVTVGFVLAGSAFGVARNGPTVSGQFIADNTPGFIKTAKKLGPEDSSKIIEVAMWLNSRNQSEMDALAGELYNRESVNYHRWLKPAEFGERFAPTPEQARAVEEFLVSHNLRVVKVGPQNWYVRARGTVAAVEKAFSVHIEKFDVNGTTRRANTSDPYVEGSVAPLVRAIYGLDDLEYEHPLSVRTTLQQTANPELKSLANGADSSFFTSNCFTGVTTQTFSSDGSYPIGTYTGNSYNGTENSAGCGYTPQEIYKAYNLNALYKAGFDGTGQTIVIIDWCGSETIMDDANTFSARFGLPPLTLRNFSIIEYPTASTCSSPNVEISLDVEWAHAIAPGANIDLLVPPTASFLDVDAATLFAVTVGLGNVMSGSFGSEELYTPKSVLIAENMINEAAAMLGISADYSSGDSGDFTFDFPKFNPPSVSAPADSPWATAVGGVTLALNPDNSIAWQTGWGNNETLLVEPGFVFDPPVNFGFVYGSGGGPSGFFAKPSFQKSLPGHHRQLPDISWVADPFTGVIVELTVPFQYPPQLWEVVGGTSVSCPMFSALWAIANQEAGASAPLGQAASYLYTMPAGTITDVLPKTSSTNVTATIQEPSVIHHYTADQLASPLEGTTKYYDAIWDIPLEQNFVYLVTFGTDSGLKTTPGWDNVTGLGTPNGKAFADFFNPHH
ncbi:MAG: S8/S53 family peptidase [Acidobacteriaceae bacterium]|nr:S8/S53 family peptidase [Acidobacteriaceae bacterium]MBV9779814.1 S8/S53 family peptidase [Acidobacteriaceae bacterium]